MKVYLESLLLLVLATIALTSCTSPPKHSHKQVEQTRERRGVSNVAGITFDMKHTVQVCNHAGHQPTWCDGTTGNDIANSTKAGGLETAIIEQLDRALVNPAQSRVFVAEFSFSAKAIQRKMCELGKAGVSVVIFLDYGSSANLAFASSPDCQKNPNVPNLKTAVLGGFTNFPEWRLHHNKTVVVDPGDGTDYNIDFSSGNLSTFGVSLHMDHWVMMKAPPTSNIARASLCLFEGLIAADKKATELGMYASTPDWSKEPTVMNTYQKTRESCYITQKVIPMNRPEEAIQKEGIAAFFTPNPGRQALITLQNEIRAVTKQTKPSYIYIAIEHFTIQAIANLLNQAAESGVDVRIIMNSGTVGGASEVTSDKPFYDANLKNGKIKVRFIETNPAAGGNGQQMHNKFAILNGKRVFSGAGHYTGSGLDGNFETLYLTQDEELTKDYAVYFKELWDVSVDESYITKGSAITTPPELSAALLEMIK